MRFGRVLIAGFAAFLATATLASAKDWKTIRIGTEGAYAPFNFKDADGKLVPRLIVSTLAVTYNGKPVLNAHAEGTAGGDVDNGIAVLLDARQELHEEILLAQDPAGSLPDSVGNVQVG